MPTRRFRTATLCRHLQARHPLSAAGCCRRHLAQLAVSPPGTFPLAPSGGDGDAYSRPAAVSAGLAQSGGVLPAARRYSCSARIAAPAAVAAPTARHALVPAAVPRYLSADGSSSHDRAEINADLQLRQLVLRRLQSLTRNPTSVGEPAAAAMANCGRNGEDPGHQHEDESYTDRMEHLSLLVADINARIPYMLHSASTASPVSSRNYLAPDILLRLFPDSRQFYETEVEEDVEEGDVEGSGAGEKSEEAAEGTDGKPGADEVKGTRRKRKLHLKIPLPRGLSFSSGQPQADTPDGTSRLNPHLSRPSFHSRPSGFPQLGRDDSQSSAGDEPSDGGMYLSLPIPQIIKGRVAYSAAVRVLQLLATTLFVRPESQIHVISSYFVGPSDELLSLDGSCSFFTPAKMGETSDGENGSTQKPGPAAAAAAHQRANQVVPKKFIVKWRTCSEGWCTHYQDHAPSSSQSPPPPQPPQSSEGTVSASSEPPALLNCVGSDHPGATVPIMAPPHTLLTLQPDAAAAPETSSSPNYGGARDDSTAAFAGIESLIRKTLLSLNPTSPNSGSAGAGDSLPPPPPSGQNSYLMGIFEFEFTPDCTQVSVHTIQDIEHIRDPQEQVILDPTSAFV